MICKNCGKDILCPHCGCEPNYVEKPYITLTEEQLKKFRFNLERFKQTEKAKSI